MQDAVQDREVSADEKRKALASILESRTFQRAAKLQDFLRFVCERATDSGAAAVVHEQDIGRAVYRRGDDYYPAEDNIVRVEARHLRCKLEDFYSKEGAGLPVIVRIPKGAYIPEFERRLPVVEPAPAAPPEPPESAPPGNPPRTRAVFGRIAIATVMLLLIALSAALFRQNRLLESRLESSRAGALAGPLWPRLFDDHHNTFVALADSGLALVQNILKRRLALSDYLKRQPGALVQFNEPMSEAERAAIVAGSPHLTSFTSVRFVSSLLGLPGIVRSRLIVRSARDLNPLDFKGNHIILIGSARSNPWVELFESKLSFRYEYDHARSRAFIRNVSPRQGELRLYRVGGEDGKSSEIYSTLALLPNLSGDGNVLMVYGTGTEGTESAWEMLFDPQLMSKLVSELNLTNTGKNRFFEVFLRSSRVGNTSTGVEIVAHRIVQ